MTKTIIGTDDDDSLLGTGNGDTIIGLGGNDALSGGNGNDFLIGDGFSSTQVTLVSTDTNGIQGDDASLGAQFSATGTQVVFSSDADNFIPGDVIGVRDVFVKDLISGALTVASTDASGHQSDGDSFDASMSAGGQVLFTTNADNLLTSIDGNGYDDILIKNLMTGAVTLISAAHDGTMGDGNSEHASFSIDGKKVLFDSDADNLTGADSNGVTDIFFKTLASGTVRLVSADADGDEANAASHNASFSQNGKLVAFESDATNLSDADTNGVTDVYAKNLITDGVILVSSSRTGVVGNAASTGIGFSSDNTDAIFSSAASNLVTHDTNGYSDIFVKDLSAGNIKLVSTNADGVEGNGNSWGATFSPDGTMIAFYSDATNLVTGDTNGATDVFVKDLLSGDVTRISNGGLGGPADGASSHISWSADGSQLVFESLADNLVGSIGGDSNGARDIFTATVDFAAAGDDVLDGGNGNDTFLPGGGVDTVTGDAGDDIAYFRGDLNALDSFDGGTGNDTLALNGNYLDQVTFGAGIVNVETVRLGSGHSYVLRTVDANVAAGATLTVDASALDSTHIANFDGSAELNGKFAFTGGAGNDSFSGGSGADTFDMSKGGNDTVLAGDGTDLITFNNGSYTSADMVNGGFGIDTLIISGDYGSGLTTGVLTSVENVVFGAGHNYNVTLTNPTGAIFNYDGRQLAAPNTLKLDASAVTSLLHVFGGAGNDNITGGQNETDFDLSSGGNDTVHGGQGSAYFTFNGGSFTSQDRVIGGAGDNALLSDDLIGLRGSPLVINGTMLQGVNFIDLTDSTHASNFATADNLIGANKAFVIHADGLLHAGFTFNGSAETDGSFTVVGGAMADTITGGAQGDHFEIGAGDIVNGGGGNDTFEQVDTSGAKTLNGGNGDDTMTLLYGGADTLTGGAGNDTFDYSGGTNLLAAGLHIDGGTGIDKLVLHESAGVPQAQVALLAQWLTNVEEIVVLGATAASFKTVDASVAAGATFIVDATAYAGRLTFDASAETNGNYHIASGSGGGTLTGGAGADVLDASLSSFFGNAVLTGNAGNDSLIGSFADDTLVGGTGNDTIRGAGGGDFITGGAGNDVFVYNSVGEASDSGFDIEDIADFDATADKFDLSFAVTGVNAQVTVASMTTANYLTVLAGSLTAAHLGAHHAVLFTATAGSMAGTYLVVDGNGTAGYQDGQELIINITGATHLSSLSTGDFI